MNLLGEKTFKFGEKEVVLKVTTKALYKTQKELNLRGLVDIVAGLESMNIEIVYTLAMHCVRGAVLTKDEIMDGDTDFMGLMQFLGENMMAVFSVDKKTKEVEKK